MRFSDSAIEVCLTLKAVFGLALRGMTGLVASLLSWRIWIGRYQITRRCAGTRNTANLAGGLHLLVDSTGIKMMGEGEWKTRKHGAPYRWQWRKPVLVYC